MASETKQVEGTINGVPYSVPEGNSCVPTALYEAGLDALNLLGELDRSPNGRHEGDSEFQDPTGKSQGNPHLRPGTQIGTHISGKRIVVPGWRELKQPAAWIVPEEDA